MNKIPESGEFAHPAQILEKSRKFTDPDRTLDGSRRASVALGRLETLWFNTGTLCNIECRNCYIESSPTNDRLAYLGPADVSDYLDEIAELGLKTREIGFTGGEPFMNRQFLSMAEDALARGYKVLILTNAMAPMMRPAQQKGLLALRDTYGDRLTLRVSLDHYGARLHDTERGPGAFAKTIEGLDWLSANGFALNVAGRTCWHEDEAAARAGYRALFAARGYDIDADNPGALILFPEMDETVDVPEISEACWGILGIAPGAVMCASSRMVVKRKGAPRPTVLPCTLLPYDRQFDMGATLSASMTADGGAFCGGAVKLNHPHCAKFCVLGGGSCSA